MAPPPDVAVFKSGSSLIWISRNLGEKAEMDALADPDRLLSSSGCRIVKDEKKIKVARIRLEVGGKVKTVYLKRYNAFSLRYRLRSVFGRSAALRSWIGAGILLRAGFHSGQPIAAVECRSWGMLTKSFYLSEEVPGALTVDDHWCKEMLSLADSNGFRRRRGFLRRLAGLFRSLHQVNVYHNDLKDANILVRTNSAGDSESFYLLDLEGVREFRQLSTRRKVKNLVQLNRTFGRFVRKIDKLFFLKCYLESTFHDREEKRKWIRNILQESARKERRSLLLTNGERSEAHGF
jgi:tRNA A-37 threonylcarbamoyl transferase component Bud32